MNSGLTGAGPSEHEIALMTERVKDELAIIKELRGLGGPSHPLEWFSDTSQFQFDLGSLRQYF